MSNQQNTAQYTQTLGSGNSLNLSDNIGGGSITEHLAGIMNFEIKEKKWDSTFKAHIDILHNRGINGDLGLPADVIMLTITKGNFTASIPMHIAATRTSDIDTRKINTLDRKTGQTLTTEVPRFISEVHQPDFIRICKDYQLNTYGTKDVTILQSVVLHNREMSDSEAVRITNFAMSRVFNHIVIYMAGDENSLTLASIHSDRDSRIDTNITINPVDSEDDMGVPRAASACMRVVYQEARGNGGSGSMIQSRSSTNVGSVHVRGSFVASNNPTPGRDPNTGMPDQTGLIWNNAYTPQVIIDDIEMGAQASFAKFLFLMAEASRFMDRDIIPKMYSESSIGYLNYRCNLGGVEVPEAIDMKSHKDKFLEIYNSMVTPNALLSMIVRPGSWNYEYTQWFHRAALGDEQAKTFIARQVCSLLGENHTAGLYSDLVIPNVEEHVVGSYSYSDASGSTAGLETCSLSEIDELWLNINMSGNSDLVNDWRESQATRDSEVGLALKFRLIGEVTQHTDVVMDRRYLITFAPTFFSLCARIVDSLASKDINNFGGFSGPVQNMWSSHIHAAGAVPLSGTTNQHNMSAGQLYHHNQSQGMYGNPQGGQGHYGGQQQPIYNPNAVNGYYNPHSS